MTCKDCLHCDICDCIGIGLPCADFQDKSEWVHMPCKVGDTAYLIENDSVREIIVETVELEYDADGIDCYISYDGHGGYLGISAFLTKEEAERH